MIRPSRPFVQVTLGNRCVSALYDSGADISCISDNEFRKIPVDQRPTRAQHDKLKNYISAGGQSLDVRGVFSLQVQVLGRTVQHPFRVICGLHEKVILGADFINQQCLGYDPCQQKVQWARPAAGTSEMKVNSLTSIPEFSSRLVATRTDLRSQHHVIAEVFSSKQPHLSGGPGLVETDEEGRCLLEIVNTGPEPIILERGQVIGQGEVLDSGQVHAIDQKMVNSVAIRTSRSGQDQRAKLLREKLNLQVPKEYEQRYVDLLIKHHAAFSLEKNDL